MESFTTSDGMILTYDFDDFTDPWKSAPTLLLLHAAMGSARRYFGWVPHLSRHYRVVRLDLRGHGRSQVPAADQPLALERLVADVAELLDHLGLEAGKVLLLARANTHYLALNQPNLIHRCKNLLLIRPSWPAVQNSPVRGKLCLCPPGWRGLSRITASRAQDRGRSPPAIDRGGAERGGKIFHCVIGQQLP